jgi:hypothetical protein
MTGNGARKVVVDQKIASCRNTWTTQRDRYGWKAEWPVSDSLKKSQPFSLSRVSYFSRHRREAIVVSAGKDYRPLSPIIQAPQERPPVDLDNSDNPDYIPHQEWRRKWSRQFESIALNPKSM